MQVEHRITIAASARRIFGIYEEVKNWPAWDPDTKVATLDGPFRVGSRGRLTPGKGNWGDQSYGAVVVIGPALMGEGASRGRVRLVSTRRHWRVLSACISAANSPMPVDPRLRGRDGQAFARVAFFRLVVGAAAYAYVARAG